MFQAAWWVADNHFLGIIKGDWVLLFCKVWLPKKNWDWFNAGCYGLLNLVYIIWAVIDIVIHKKVVQGRVHCAIQAPGAVMKGVLSCWWFWRLLSHFSLSGCCLWLFWRVLSLKRAIASCYAMSLIGSWLAGVRSKPKVSMHCKKRTNPMMNKKAPMTSRLCLSHQKQELTLLACMSMLCFGKDICKFQH